MQNYLFERRPPAAGEGAPCPPPPVRETLPALTRPRRAKILLPFVGFLLAIGVVTGALFLLKEPEALLDAPEGPVVPTPTAPATATTVERAPTGGGATMDLTPLPAGEPHSFQEIYAETVNAIVSIRGLQAGGMSLGTGVILSEDGYIVTNAHVIAGCSSLDVTLWDERVYNGLLVGRDSETDLAVLKIDAHGLTPAEFGDSELLRVGDVALAIGNPLGENLRGTMTDGIISAINRDVNVDGHTMTLIQTTAALNSGNSGGALVNAFGQVVGITNMKMQSYYNTVEGLGFAIPTVTAKGVVDELIAHGVISGRPTIGVTVVTLTEAAAEYYGAPLGVRVEAVERASDAWAKGIRPGDVIVEANGSAVHATGDLLAAKEGLAAGETLSLRVWREGAYRQVEVRLVEQYTLDP